MGTSLGNRSHCSRGLNARATPSPARRSLTLPGLHTCRTVIPGSARVSRAGDDVSSSRTFLKTVSARRRNQHARRVRYPETVACVRFSGKHRLPACKSRQLAETGVQTTAWIRRNVADKLPATAGWQPALPRKGRGIFTARTLRARSVPRAKMRALRPRNGASR